MDKKWRQSLAVLTGGADLWNASIKSCGLAALATLLTIPWFHYLLFHVPTHVPLRTIANPHDLLYAQSALLFVICLMSAMVGYGLMRRFELPGFGRIDAWLGSLPTLLAIGLLLLLVSQWVFDGDSYRISPAAGPDKLFYLLAIPLNAAITDEMILRFGFVTIAVGLCRNKLRGVVLAALFAVMLTEKYFTYIGVYAGLDYVTASRFVFSFFINFLLGYLFVTRGLLSSMTVNLVLGLRYPMAALMGG